MQTVKDVKHLTNLRRWVMSHGGWIHPAVVCGLSPNFGCRGLLSLEDIPFADSGEQTIILLPNALRITDNVAKDVLADKVSAASIQEMEAKSALKGVLLAYERSRTSSCWGPYLATLPAQPSAGWCLKPAEAAHALQKLGLPGCKAFYKARRQSKIDLGAGLARRFGKVLGISASDIVWGLATVACRSYQGPQEDFLFPVIDLANHSVNAATIQGVKIDGEDFVRGRIQQQRHSFGFKAGNEVLVDYGLSGDRSACDSFMDYGFVL